MLVFLSYNKLEKASKSTFKMSMSGAASYGGLSPALRKATKEGHVCVESKSSSQDVEKCVRRWESTTFCNSRWSSRSPMRSPTDLRISWTHSWSIDSCQPVIPCHVSEKARKPLSRRTARTRYRVIKLEDQT